MYFSTIGVYAATHHASGCSIICSDEHDLSSKG